MRTSLYFFLLRASTEDLKTFLNEENSLNATNETAYSRCEKSPAKMINATLTLPLTSEEYLYVYSALIIGLVALSLIRSVVFRLMLTRSSFALHSKMFRAIIQTPVLFFDRNPVGKCFL